MSRITKFTFKDNSKETKDYFIDKILNWFEEIRNPRLLINDYGRPVVPTIPILVLRRYLVYFEKGDFTYRSSLGDEFLKYLESLNCWSKIEDNLKERKLKISKEEE